METEKFEHCGGHSSPVLLTNTVCTPVREHVRWRSSQLCAREKQAIPLYASEKQQTRGVKAWYLF